MKNFAKYNRIYESVMNDDAAIVYMETSASVNNNDFAQRVYELKSLYPEAEFALFNDVVYKYFGPEYEADDIIDFVKHGRVRVTTPDWGCVVGDYEAYYDDDINTVMVVSEDFDPDVLSLTNITVISMETGEEITQEDFDDDVETYANESVSERFAKYRSIFESEDAEDEDSDEAGDENTDDESEESDDENADEEDDEDDEKPMTGIILQIKKKDVDALKDELEKYDIVEDDITVLNDKEDEDETEGDDEELVDVRINIDKAIELKNYLKEKKNIDIEDKLGVEFVEDDGDEEDETSDDSEDSENKEDKNDGEKDEDDMNYADFGDIFDTK